MDLLQQKGEGGGPGAVNISKNREKENMNEQKKYVYRMCGSGDKWFKLKFSPII